MVRSRSSTRLIVTANKLSRNPSEAECMPKDYFTLKQYGHIDKSKMRAAPIIKTEQTPTSALTSREGTGKERLDGKV